MSIRTWFERHAPWVKDREECVYRFSVPVIRGWQRAGRDRRTGRTYTPHKMERAEKDVARAFQKVYGACTPPVGPDVPVSVTIAIAKPLPTSSPKCLLEAIDYTKPDVDNVAKLVLDALTGVAYVDDKQVVSLTVERMARSRRWGAETFVEVSIPRAWDKTLNRHRKYRALR